MQVEIANNNNKKKKQGISLITLLAHQSTGQAQKLLKKYNKPQGDTKPDLEDKLADLYLNAPDKIALEKELAEMHPHRSFILRNLAPKVEPVKPDLSESEVKTKTKEFIENSSNFEGNRNCNCNKVSNACGCNSNFSNACGCGGSNFAGIPDTKETPTQANPMAQYVGPALLLFICGMTFYIVHKATQTK